MMNIYREYHHKLSEQRKLRETGYGEVTYTDHYVDSHGEFRTIVGTEDFSIERWRTIVSRVIYKPTGKFDRGGHKRWEAVGTIRAKDAKTCGTIARLVYSSEEISVRQY